MYNYIIRYSSQRRGEERELLLSTVTEALQGFAVLNILEESTIKPKQIE